MERILRAWVEEPDAPLDYEITAELDDGDVIPEIVSVEIERDLVILQSKNSVWAVKKSDIRRIRRNC